MTRPLRTLLIANRGEIAVRIIRTAARLGLSTVAAFSDADAGALHVGLADAAVRIGPAPARESYLDSAAILAAAKATGADAVHPGYGFLAENAGFARTCTEAGLIFVGPPAGAIEAMGSKSGARSLMQAAGVPVVPGYEGEDQSETRLAKAAETIGFPVLIKASAGGGGKGMRVVEDAAALPAALASARREASAAFGDDRVILERYLPAGRHVEVQVFADQAGETVHLFERDCSIQRRHQKVIEEAPAFGLSEPLRQALHQAAIACARAVGYVGAGTVEFLVADQNFFFMEMNTRLQVEHPVTEAITGLDLVEWQLRIARGEPLPRRQDQIHATGWAIEARLCAEDPAADFLPQSGRLDHLHFGETAGVRIDTGFRTGDAVPPFYDSLIAKIIAAGADRAEAAGRLARALAATEVAGLRTNRALLGRIVGHPAFLAEEIDTRFIDRHRDALLAAPTATASDIALAAFAALRRAEQAVPIDTVDPHSAWGDTSGWRLGRRAMARVELGFDGRTITVEAAYRDEGYALSIDSGEPVVATSALAVDEPLGSRADSLSSLDASRSPPPCGEEYEVGVVRDRARPMSTTPTLNPSPQGGGQRLASRSMSSQRDHPRATAISVQLGNILHRAHAVFAGPRLTLITAADELAFDILDPYRPIGGPSADAGHLTSPMPGTVVAVAAAAGDTVAKGAPLVVVEAMKMEHAILAPRSGRIRAVTVAVGDQVAAGTELVVMEEPV